MSTHYYRHLFYLEGDVWGNKFPPCRLMLILFIIALSYDSLSEAQIYQWVDNNGSLHFGQTAPQGASHAAKIEVVLPAKTSTIEFDPPQKGSEKIQQGGRQSHDGEERTQVVNQQVTAEMYSTSWCGYCRKAREYFRTRGIQLIEYDIEADPIAAERKRQIDTRPGVPLIVINGQLIHGYAPALYERALARQR